MWAIGYVFCILSILYKLIKKSKFDQIMALQFFSIISTGIWIQCLEGYIRYGIFVCFLYCIILYASIIQFLEKRKIKIIRLRIKIYYYIIFLFKDVKSKISNYIRGASKIINCCIIGSWIMFCMVMIIFNLDFENIEYILKDRKTSDNIIKIDGIWGNTKDVSQYSSLVRDENTPMYSLEKSFFESSEKALKMWYDKILNNDIYVIINYKYGNFYDNNQIKKLKENNFEIQQVVDTYDSNDISYIDANHVWVLVKVKYIGDVK